jgi:hypothetical protein
MLKSLSLIFMRQFVLAGGLTHQLLRNYCSGGSALCQPKRGIRGEMHKLKRRWKIGSDQEGFPWNPIRCLRSPSFQLSVIRAPRCGRRLDRAVGTRPRIRGSPRWERSVDCWSPMVLPGPRPSVL